MSAAPEPLESYLSGAWQRGEGVENVLIDPVHGTELATTSARGLCLASAIGFARSSGGHALRGLSFAERGKMINAIADVLVPNRSKYELIAITNSGNTKSDAAIDIDGGIFTLRYYARLADGLGDARFLLDDKPLRLTKSDNFKAVHLLTPRHGVAVHINAFNFPSWGLWEKAAVSLLAGVPVIVKPASSTAMLAHAMVRDIISANILPLGSLSFLCGAVGDLLSNLTSDDVIAFTGSSSTAKRIRTHPNVLARGITVNVEADSVNAALLSPDAKPADAIFESFVKEVAREITVKAGQKCTAIRRVFVSIDVADNVAEALLVRLRKIKLGDPRRDDVDMGPVVTRSQQVTVMDGIRQLATQGRVIVGGAAAPDIQGIDPAKSAFVAPTLIYADDVPSFTAVHDIEVFGPVATIIPYRSEQNAFDLVAAGGGSLVASAFGNDRAFFARAVEEIGTHHGRMLMVDPSIVSSHSGHGVVLPQCNHGGPGRAGNGEELGGLYGLRLYHQRLAVQGSSELLAHLCAKGFALH